MRVVPVASIQTAAKIIYNAFRGFSQSLKLLAGIAVVRESGTGFVDHLGGGWQSCKMKGRERGESQTCKIESSASWHKFMARAWLTPISVASSWEPHVIGLCTFNLAILKLAPFYCSKLVIVIVICNKVHVRPLNLWYGWTFNLAKML